MVRSITVFYPSHFNADGTLGVSHMKSLSRVIRAALDTRLSVRYAGFGSWELI